MYIRTMTHGKRSLLIAQYNCEIRENEENFNLKYF